MVKIYYILATLFFSVTLSGQEFDSTMKRFKLKLVTQTDSTPIKYAKVISYITYDDYATDKSGFIELVIDESDSIRVAAVGYTPTTIKASSLSTKRVNICSIPTFTYTLPECTIRLRNPDSIFLNLPCDIKLGQASDVPMRLRNRSLSPLEAIASPITNLFSNYKDVEKSRTKVRELMAEDRRKQNHDYQILNRAIIADESQFTGDSLEYFIMICNTHIKISPYYREVHVRTRIRELVDSYKKGELAKND